MRHIKLLGLALLASLACFAIATAAASAELPTLLPAPTTKAPLTFTGKTVAKSAVTLKTEKSVIECVSAETTQGEFVKEEANLGIKNKLLFKGCKSAGAKCKTAGAKEEEEIEVNAEVTLVTMKEGTTLLGGALVSIEGTGIVIKCGIISDEVKGGALGKFEKSKGVALVSLEKTKSPLLVFKETATQGEQAFTKCESPKSDCTAEHKLEANFGSGFALAAQTAELEVTLNKEIEAHF